VLLLAKLTPLFSPHLEWLGNPALAFLTGVGAAVAVGGAVSGTISTQAWATINAFDPQVITEALRKSPFSSFLVLLNLAILLVGIFSVIVSFQYGTGDRYSNRPNGSDWLGKVGKIGRIFIAMVMGALFAGVLMACMSALVERYQAVVSFLHGLYRLVIR
jgi:hypothetical protein